MVYFYQQLLHKKHAIVADKNWITHSFHQQFIELVNLILPQAVIRLHYKIGQPIPQPCCQKLFWRNAVQK